MKNLLLACFFIFAFSGCSTPNQMRSKTPAINNSSNKNAKELAYCISDKWDNLSFFNRLSDIPTNIQQKNTGFVVTKTVENITHSWVGFLADIDTTSTGSAIKYYKGNLIGSGSYDDAINACL